jgi:hypothetical protein
MAVALPVLLLLATAGMAAVAVISAQLRCQDAAREAARAAARGEPAPVVRMVAARAAPRGADVAIAVQGDSVTVAVSVEAHYLARLIPPVTVHARAVAAVEPSPSSSPFVAVGAATVDGVVRSRPAFGDLRASPAGRRWFGSLRAAVRPGRRSRAAA